MTLALANLKKNKGELYIYHKIMWLDVDNKSFFWDVNSFRPNLRDSLDSDTFYDIDLYFDVENLYSGTEITIPRVICIDNNKFVNVR